MKHRSVYRTELTPVSFLERSAAVFPDKTAVVHGDRRYTYRQFAERVNRLASALRGAGLARTTASRSSARTSPRCWRRTSPCPPPAASWSPINTRLSSDEIGYILDHSGARFLFVDTELAAAGRAARPAGHRASSASTTPAQRRRPLRGLPRRGLAASRSRAGSSDEEETIAINYTSGTTGRPKGVDVHPPRRLPQRPRQGDRDAA